MALNDRQERSGNARVYLDEPPEHGAHPGYRGYVVADALGIHVSGGDWLAVNPSEEGWPMGEWFPDEGGITTLPWHRVNCINWGDEWAVKDES